VNYYTQTIVDDFNSFCKSFSLKNPKTATCAKASISACIAYLISIELELGSNYWAPFCCFIMITPYLGTGLEKGIYRITGTVLGAFLAFIVFGFTVQNQFYYTLFLFFIAIFCYYKQATSKSMGYFWFMIILSFTLISSIGFEQTLSALQFAQAAFYRSANLSIGIAVYLIVNYLFKPKYASDELDQKISLLKSELSAFAKEVFQQYLNHSFSQQTVISKYSSIKNLTKTIETLTYSAHFEKKTQSSNPKEIDYIKVFDYIDNLITFHQSVSAATPVTYQLNHSKQISKITQLFETFLQTKDPISLEKIKADINMQFSIMNLKYAKTLKHGRYLIHSTADTYLFQEAVILLKDYFTFFILMETIYKKPQDETNNQKEDKYDEFLGYKEYDFMGFKLFLHKPHLKFAIRTAITLIAVVWGWKFLDLPSDMGTGNITLAVMTASMPDYLSSTLKGLLRFLGCSIGFLIGIALLVFNIESTTVMLIAVFSVGYITSLFMLSCPKISYIGLQTFLAFCVAFIPGWGPVTDFEKVFLRFISIFFGIIAMWLISSLLWKSDYFSVVKDGIFLFWKRFNNFRISNPTDYSPKILGEGVALLKFNIDKLTITSSITSSEQATLKKWCDAIERLLISSRNLIAISEDSKHFISDASKEVILRIQSLCETFSFVSINEKCADCNNSITEIFTEIESLKHLIRNNGLLRNKDMPFKQETMRCIVLMKRLAARLRDINNIQIELIPIFAKQEAL